MSACFDNKEKGAFPMLGLAKSSIWLFITIPVCRDMNWGKAFLGEKKKNAGNFSLSYREKLEEVSAL